MTDNVPAPGRLSVLLVDDHADVRFLLRRVFESDGHFDVIGEAGDGVEGVKLASSHQPDVAVVDLAMPVMDGFQAIPLIRSGSPRTKVVVLTAFRGSQMAAEAAGAGADAYVEKANGLETLVNKIKSLYGVASPRPVDAETTMPSPPRPRERAGPGPDIDEVLSKLNHELRTPLAVIQGFAVRIQDMADDPEPDRETLKRSAEAIERNASVLSTMLQLFSDARDVDAGRLDLDMELVKVSEFLTQLLADLEVITGDRPVTMTVENGMTVHADRMRLRQIVTNLVSNAAKFSPAGTPIEVQLTRRGKTAELSVRDHGNGIPEGRERDLFGKFVRFASGTKGTGLGLYISRGIARALGGDLGLADNSPTGCRFVLTLPLAGPRD